ncbi:MAG TPA: Gfo/Idh/MocA family oxidoreductase [Polyangiaceae bacterium]|nr:Gfo/Idh/MocA family oxidoreductase [Polyangiaceae bacterium]
MDMNQQNSNESKVRYAVVGLGAFAQEAILPAFKNSTGCELAALVSGDDSKRRELAQKYNVRRVVGYEQYDSLLASGDVDAVYIALPNTLHCEYTVRAARAGVHVLCEKPMAMDEAECREMIGACRAAKVKLMIAYRLHFEQANMTAVELVQAGEIGEPRLFSSIFTMQVDPHNSRIDPDLDAGPLYDIGIYCINAARYIFRAEPYEALACTGRKADDPRFDEVEEQLAGLLRFSDDRLATFAVGFGAENRSRYEVVGTSGSLALDPAYSHRGELCHELHSHGRTSRRKFSSHDQIAPEIIHFASCIRQDRDPEPPGEEGLADVRIIRALYESAATGRAVRIEPSREKRPDALQAMRPHNRPAKSVPAHQLH